MKILHVLLKPLLVSLSMFLLPVTLCSAAPTFSLSASPTGPHYGQPFTVNVVASGVTDLYGYQFDIDFNPALFQAESVAAGPFLATAGATFFDPGTIDNTAGVISFVFDTLLGPGAGANGSGLLADISFMASATKAGPGTISLNNVLALDSNLNLITVQTSSALVTVPEPASVLLVLAGLLTLAWSTKGRWSRT